MYFHMRDCSSLVILPRDETFKSLSDTHALYINLIWPFYPLVLFGSDVVS